MSVRQPVNRTNMSQPKPSTRPKLKRYSFNLIRKDLVIKETIKTERDWYTLFNTIIICFVILLSTSAWVLRVSLENDLNEKKGLLSQTANKNLNTTSKEAIKQKVSALNDKYSLYEEFLNQNFDVNKFYTEALSIYPNVKIDKFITQPNSDFVDVDFRLEANGYSELSTFFSQIESDSKFKNATVKNIVFDVNEISTNTLNQRKLVLDNLQNPNFITARVTLSLDKNITKD